MAQNFAREADFGVDETDDAAAGGGPVAGGKVEPHGVHVVTVQR